MTNSTEVRLVDSPALGEMSTRLKVDKVQLQQIIMTTVMPVGDNAPVITEEIFTSFLVVANEYQLNPLTKEIYAFPDKRGGIQAIVSIDGWLRIINQHPKYDGMEFDDQFDDKGNLVAVTCKIYRKDRAHPTPVTEYMAECKQGTNPWSKWPARMLRHKATIQAARYAFGLSGIIDPDEAERFEQAGVIEKDITPKTPAIAQPTEPATIDYYPDDEFEKNLPAWCAALTSKRHTIDTLLSLVESKAPLSEQQMSRLQAASMEEAA